jgi:hypothetical protein
MQYTQVRCLSQGSLLVVPAGNALKVIAAGVEELGTRVWARSFHFTRWWSVVGLGLLLLLAGCSASGGSSGGTNITLGLAGSTADRPSSPPAVAQSGPDATYAFIYDDQIWVRQTGSSTPTQITHLVLSNGADITFGPLVWSPDGEQIAFALVENLTPSAPGRTAGPIYVVTISNGYTEVTPGIGSIYGHTYSWYGPRMLFYSSGDGISMYDINDPDPRVWQVVSPVATQDRETFTNNNVSFGDISITNNFDLFYGLAQISSLGGSGAIGTAGVYETKLPSLDLYNTEYNNNYQTSPVAISEWLYSFFQVQTGFLVANLGQAYSDTEGNISMGSWQVSAGESKMVRQMINTVDAKSQMVSSQFCVSSLAISFNGCQPVLSDAGTCSQSLHGQLTLSPDGSHMAYTCDTLYVSATSGGSDSKVTSVGWITPAAMITNGQTTIATRIVSSSKDSNGVLRIQTNLVAFDGTKSYVLIKGAQSASLQ